MAEKPQKAGYFRKSKAELVEEILAVKAENDGLKKSSSTSEEAGGEHKVSLKFLRDAVEGIRDGFALFDADDRFVFCNENYRRYTGEVASTLKPGATFEDILRAAIMAERIVGAKEQPEVWLRERLERHRRGGVHMVRHLDLAGQAIMMNEYKTRSGGTVILRTDITERVRAEEALRDSEEKFRAAFDNSINGITLMSRDRKVHLNNSALARLLGYTIEELRSIRLSDLRIDKPNARAIADQERERLAAGETERHIEEEQFRRKDGSTVWCETSRAPIFDSKGNFAYRLTVRQDITERKRAEDSLRASEERFRTAFDNSLVGISLINHDNGTRTINPALARMLGYTVDELHSVRLHDLIDSTGKERIDQLHLEFDSGRKRSSVDEEQFHRRDGSIIWFETSRSAIFDSSGKLNYILAIRQDITERKRAIESLRESEERFRTAFDNSIVGISMVNEDNTVRFINPALAKMLGYTRAELQMSTAE